MPIAGMNQTVFGDVRQRAKLVYRVKTRSSEYLIGIHEADGRRFAIVRGMPGSDRESSVARDSDPRVGGHSMFELPLDQWPGKMLEVATMTTSPIVLATVESDPRAIAAVSAEGAHAPVRSPWARPASPSAERAAGHAPPIANPPMPQQVKPPASASPNKLSPVGLPENPRIVPVSSKGTHPAIAAAELAAKWPQPAGAPTQVDVPASPVAPQVVVGKQPVAASPADPQLPYPQRHVGYAESAAALLRSIAKRDRLFEDLSHDRELKERLRRSLDDCVALLEQIRRRDRA